MGGARIAAAQDDAAVLAIAGEASGVSRTLLDGARAWGPLIAAHIHVYLAMSGGSAARSAHAEENIAPILHAPVIANVVEVWTGICALLGNRIRNPKDLEAFGLLPAAELQSALSKLFGDYDSVSWSELVGMVSAVSRPQPVSFAMEKDIVNEDYDTVDAGTGED